MRVADVRQRRRRTNGGFFWFEEVGPETIVPQGLKVKEATHQGAGKPRCPFCGGMIEVITGWSSPTKAGLFGVCGGCQTRFTPKDSDFESFVRLLSRRVPSRRGTIRCGGCVHQVECHAADEEWACERFQITL